MSWIVALVLMVFAGGGGVGVAIADGDPEDSAELPATWSPGDADIPDPVEGDQDEETEEGLPPAAGPPSPLPSDTNLSPSQQSPPAPPANNPSPTTQGLTDPAPEPADALEPELEPDPAAEANEPGSAPAPDPPPDGSDTTSSAAAALATVPSVPSGLAATSRGYRCSALTRAQPAALHVVQPGESLWSIALGLLGDRAPQGVIADLAARVWDLNADRIGSADPDLIHPGDELLIPDPYTRGTPCR